MQLQDFVQTTDFAETPSLFATRAGLLQDILDGLPLARRLERLTQAAERLSPGLMASVLLVEGDRLRLAAAPSLPESYNRLVDGKPIAEGMGSCGTAAHRREMVVAADLQVDPLWKNYREVARRFGLGACWSMPIFDRNKEVVGTLALYFREPRRPIGDELDVFRELASLAAVGIDHDRLERRFIDSQGGFKELVDDLDSVVWEADAQSRQFTYISRNVEAVLGYPIERWRQQPGFWQSIIHSEDRASTVRQYEQAVRVGVGYECEYRVRAADGRTLWLRDIAHAHDGGGAVGHKLHGVIINISRQREAEQEREQLLERVGNEQALLHSVLAQMPVGVLVAEAPSGRILMANDRAQSLIEPRLTPGDVDGYAGWKPLRPSGEPYLREEWPINRAIATGECVLGEVVSVLRPSGSRRTLAVSAAPVRDGKGAIVAGVSFISDETGRWQEQEGTRVLAEAGKRFGASLDPELTIESAASLACGQLGDWCAVFMRREDGAIRCATLSVRDASKAALQAELERLCPQPGGTPFQVAETIASGQSRLFAKVDAQDFGPGAVRGDLVRVLRALGAETAMTVPLPGSDGVLGALVCGSAEPGRRFGADELRLVEELGRRAARALDNARIYADARGAIRHREEFLSIAAHELKTPLAGLQLAIETLSMQLERPALNVDVLRGRAAASKRHMSRLVRLIEELLDVSTVRAGRMQLARERMDLVEAVSTVVGRFRDELRSKGIDVLVHAPEPVIGEWDPRRIDQVATNLLSNAIKYGDHKPIRVVVQGSGPRVLLRVEDQGIGIAPETTRRIFRPFERGVAPGHYGGLGLGLHITAQIVAAHGGTVSVESCPQEGSAFIVDMPREEGA